MNIENFLDQHEKKELLRFITCGSVDDGKSTLIGRLLYDSKVIFDDQLSALRNDSERVGTTGDTGEIDYALLLDGLKAEREQGITIDVAYRYFSTPQRKFIIADTPGHEQYTRNMATGASTASLAIILIDARRGVQTQTRRHSFIVSLLGIRQVVVAINKMDLAGYSRQTFEDIRQEFETFRRGLDFDAVEYIPLSALRGDNVVKTSALTPWYQGSSLLEYLEQVDTCAQYNYDDFRFAVQYVNRPNLNFRGFSGTVLSGAVRSGERVRTLPSGRESRVREIVTRDGNLEEAFAPQAVTLVLEDEIDISNGDMIVDVGTPPAVSHRIEADLVWMNEVRLRPGVFYLLRHGGRTSRAKVEAIEYRVDVNSLRRGHAEDLGLNEIARVTISTVKPLFCDPYRINRETGSFILIDQNQNNTVAAGMIIRTADSVTDTATTSEKTVERGVDWEGGAVSSHERVVRNRHRSRSVVITGKGNDAFGFELGKALERALFRLHLHAYYLALRPAETDFDHDDRLRQLGETARVMTDAGMIFITVLPDADSTELARLRELTAPGETMVVRLDDDQAADVSVTSSDGVDEGTKRILKLFQAYQIIPEYCI